MFKAQGGVRRIVEWLMGEGERERCGGEFRVARMVGVVTRWMFLGVVVTYWCFLLARFYDRIGAGMMEGREWDGWWVGRFVRDSWDDDWDGLKLVLAGIVGGLWGVCRYLWVRHHEEEG